MGSSEIWVPIPYANGYEASSYGRIRSFCKRGAGSHLLHTKPKLLKLYQDQSGYFRVSLHGKTHWVHIVICTTFKGNPPEGKECSHTDGDKSNNANSNLEWESKLENEAKKLTHGTRLTGSKVGTSKLDEKTVAIIRRNFSGERGEISLLAKKHNVEKTTMRRVVRDLTWRSV
jgi:hypothetical protein